jgi:hypothetical protein
MPVPIGRYLNNGIIIGSFADGRASNAPMSGNRQPAMALQAVLARFNLQNIERRQFLAGPVHVIGKLKNGWGTTDFDAGPHGTLLCIMQGSGIVMAGNDMTPYAVGYGDWLFVPKEQPFKYKALDVEEPIFQGAHTDLRPTA